MEEKWADAIGYEGFYQVSNLGNVRSVDRVIIDSRGRKMNLCGKQLKPALSSQKANTKHYWQVHLHVEGTESSCYVHDLVALAWIGPKPTGQCTLHGPKGSEDNSVENLSYGTPMQNARDRGRDGSKQAMMPVLCSNGVRYESMQAAARALDLWAGNISKVTLGISKQTGGFSFELI